jgi:hypothetical protein
MLTYLIRFTADLFEMCFNIGMHLYLYEVQGDMIEGLVVSTLSKPNTSRDT